MMIIIIMMMIIIMICFAVVTIVLFVYKYKAIISIYQVVFNLCVAIQRSHYRCFKIILMKSNTVINCRKR